MNIFILNTGRCGSTTFIKACQHINNYSSAHESRINIPGELRLAYPQNHIEADNRLSWFLGRLESTYGDNAVYVHLRRNTENTIKSFIKRENYGIIKAYREGILLDETHQLAIEDIAADYVHTVTENINTFLRNKSQTMIFNLENSQSDFQQFLQLINAKGDLQSAINEWNTIYNAS